MIETVLLSLILLGILVIVFRLMVQDVVMFKKMFGNDYALNRKLKEILFEKSVYAVVATDLYGKILMWNERAQKKFGYKEEEMIGKNISVIMPERFRPMHEAGLKNYREGGESRLINNDEGIEVIGLHKNGNEFPIHLKLISLTLLNLKIVGGFIRNITKDKAKEKVFTDKIRLLESGEKCADLASWYWQLLDNEKKIVQVSDNFYEVFDVDESKTVTSDLLMELVYYKDRMNTAITINQAIENKENYTTSYRRLLSNGSLRLVQVKGCLIFNEENDVIAINGTIQTLDNGVDGS